MSQPDEQDALSQSVDGARLVPAPHAEELRKAASPPLAALDGCRVLVRISIAGEERLVAGQAEYGTDGDLGNVLRIYVSRHPEIIFVVAEDVFRGRIVPGQQHGCDYLIHAEANPSAVGSDQVASR